jgi:hypothetical protein
MLNKAIQIAVEAHYRQTDKQGQPYVLHPLAIMHEMPTVEGKIVAVLHDVLEDTSITPGWLEARGFTKEIMDALVALCHNEGESYADYLIRLKENSLATEVKIADLEHNFNLPRTLFRGRTWTSDTRRMQKYVLSWQYLNHELSQNQLREALGICR